MDSSETVSPTAGKAIRTCISCKDRKRKCDKALPICSLCQRMKWTCQYAIIKPVQQKPSKESQLVAPNAVRPHFPVVFFLDAEAFQRARLELPSSPLRIPQQVTDLVGDLTATRSVAAEYFETIHLWLPFMSKKLFYEHVLNPLYSPAPHAKLLFLCMRLVVSVPSPAPEKGSMQAEEEPWQAPIYLSAKSFLADLEMAGICSIQILQAAILIALFELGHGIYPSAVLTVGQCVRYGVAFGFDGKYRTGTEKGSDWIEAEERKRAWWAVLILDRFCNLGHPMRALATEDPESLSLLPMDDAAWDRGVDNSDHEFTISSPASVTMGRFARFAQAAYLLGSVLRHVSDHNVEMSFRDAMAIQLYRTLNSLISLAEIEASIRNTEFCTQTALCYSALLILNGPHGSEISEASVGKEYFKPTTNIAAIAAGISAKIVHCAQDQPLAYARYVSPFLLHSLYRASIIYTELWQSTRDENAYSELASLKGAMNVMNTRWKVAGAYLDILNAKDATYY